MPSRSRNALIRGLARRKVREREGLFLAEGVRVVEDLLASAIVPRLALVSTSLEDTPRGVALARRLDAACALERVSDAELAALADTETAQGVVVAAEMPQATLAGLRPADRDVIVLLDAVQDPGNAGTIIRTADALGCRAVIALPGTVDLWNPKVVRAAAGSLFHLPVVETEAAALGEWAREAGVTIVAADAGGATVDGFAATGPLLLAVGNEGAGVGSDVGRMASARIAIPIRGAAESLNVAVATGILLYELTRQRTGTGEHT